MLCKWIALALALLAMATPCIAQPIDWARAETDARSPEVTDTGIPAAKSLPLVSPAVQAASDEYYITSLKHRAAIFGWQAFAAKVIFWTVIALVFSGLAFSGFQFYYAIRHDTAGATQEIELSLKVIKVKSQFLGVITLALSLAFFYLYVSSVYPIVPVGNVQTSAHAK